LHAKKKRFPGVRQKHGFGGGDLVCPTTHNINLFLVQVDERSTYSIFFFFSLQKHVWFWHKTCNEVHDVEIWFTNLAERLKRTLSIFIER
jgi:hypothetical protein